LTVTYLSGELRQRRTGVGWASLRSLPEPAAEATLEIREVDDAFGRAQALSGSGSSLARREEIERLFARATQEEQRFLSLLVIGELRQGALAGIMADAVARAAGVELTAVRRAAMLAGDLPAVAEAALAEGLDGLARFHLRLGQPIQPMLAQTAPDLAAALERTGEAAVEWKLDGVRVQVHRVGGEVTVFSRSLDVITDRVPEVVEAALALPARSTVLDGEVIALRADGRPRPFQVTGSRVASREDVAALRRAVPLTAFFFDLLHLDGEDLIDEPGSDRSAALASILAPELQVPRVVTADAGRATAFFDDAIGHGHEGVMVKALSSPYEAGRRGTGWIKVKPRHTLDLVVLAAEWGHGRRKGWLSNLHLGARDPASGGFVMLGKTFKGLTDTMLEWQTAELLARETGRAGIAVHVRPELVVEIAFDGVQTSPRYPGGMALRFARVLRYREDKAAGEADTVDMVRMLHEAGI
ncbi:MAG TPA: ATP-dependent DNA ligase, partial [Candidatus Dormibacteraeota bacterium]|nr:ATP-dependent DNA ligase [Candidatus Dormibacteraeota bacterium]